MTIPVGAQVRYTAAFLGSIGAYTGPVPFARGTVTAIEVYGAGPDAMTLAVIDWGEEGIPKRVNIHNLDYRPDKNTRWRGGR